MDSTLREVGSSLAADLILPRDRVSHVVCLVLAHHVSAARLLAIRNEVTLGILVALAIYSSVFTIQTVDVHEILIVLDIRDFKVISSERSIIDAFHSAVHSRLQ